MTAMQFDAEVHEGVLALPPTARAAFEGPVHVILVKGEDGPSDDLIAELIESPLDLPDFEPLSRDEANDRSR